MPNGFKIFFTVKKCIIILILYSITILYLRACEYLINEKRDAECEKIGLEAIGLLCEELIIRGKVADLTAKAAKKLSSAFFNLEGQN